MHDTTPKKQAKSVLGRLRWSHPDAYDAVSMAVYIMIVYALGLRIYPQGHDFALLAHGQETLSPMLAHALQFTTGGLGSSIAGYHLLNMLLMFLCMECMFYVARFVIKGPFWLGTLAAVLFMANPVHTEAMANVTGLVDLLPCLLALAALFAYIRLVRKGTWGRRAVAWVVFGVAAAAHPANAALVLVLLLLEALVLTREERRYERLVPFCIITAAAAWFHGASLIAYGFSLKEMFAPLYFILYPIGFLPESAQRFHAYPLLGWLAAAAVIVLVVLIYRKARRPAILFGLLAMVAARLLGGGRGVDPVHLVGGGQLLLANAFFAMALVALFHRIMDHPRWRGTIVTGTTTLCLVFFAMQVHALRMWRDSGKQVKAFQEQAAQWAKENPEGVLAVCPDYQYRRGAPMCLSEAIHHDTLFSTPIPAQAFLPLHSTADMKVFVEEWAADGGTVRVEGVPVLEVVPWPYGLADEGGEIRTEHGVATLTDQDESGFTVQVKPVASPLPQTVLPGSSTAGRTPPEAPSPHK